MCPQKKPFWHLSKDRNLHGSGMSHATTASPKPFFREPWRVLVTLHHTEPSYMVSWFKKAIAVIYPPPPTFQPPINPNSRVFATGSIYYGWYVRLFQVTSTMRGVLQVTFAMGSVVQVTNIMDGVLQVTIIMVVCYR